MAPASITTTNIDTTPQRHERAEPATDQLQFGVMVFPDAPFPTLIERMRRVEALGFDQLVIPDHIGDLRNLSETWFDGWSVLTAAATQTERIRIGTLVTNPILRAPAVLAKQAIAVDHLSGGRLDLGVGAGVFDFDHHAVGTEPWSAKERMGRFAEYVEIVDGILRGGGRPYTFQGTWLWARDVPTAPGSAQRPRPPLIVGGQSPTILRVAAERADAWDTIGPIGVGADEVVAITGRQSRRLDELCAAAGRDPATLLRSLALYGPFDPWESPVTLEEVVDRFAPLGFSRFVLSWPPDDRLAEFEHGATAVIPALRNR